MRWRGYLGMAALAMMVVAFCGQNAVAADPSMDPALQLAAGASSTANMHNDAGIENYNKGNAQEAEKHFSEAVQADPKSAEAHYNLALTLDSLGRHKEAAAEFKKAYDLGSKNPKIANSDILKKHLGMK
jgi:Flp pilus assembly protein TadD